MQVHLICVPIAISFWFYFLSIQLHNHKSNFSKFNFIPIVGLILVVYQLFPPNDLVEGLKTWNTNISFYGLTLKLRTLLLDTFSVGTSLVFIIFTPLMIYVQAKDLWKCNNKQVFIVIASFLVVFFSYFLISVLKYLGFNHFSFLFYTLLAYAAIMFGLSMRKFNIRWYFLLIPILLILIYQAKVKINDYHLYPFSNANKVADFLDKNYDSSPVLIVPEPFMNSVVLYDNDNTVYYSLFRHKCCKYVIWNHPSVDHLRRKILPIDLNELKTAMFTVPDSILMNSPVLVVGGDRSSLIVDRNQVVVNGDIVINDTIMLKMICKFDQPKANWLTEIFWLYEVVVKK